MLVHEISVLLVIVNAMRLLRRRRPRGGEPTATSLVTHAERQVAMAS